MTASAHIASVLAVLRNDVVPFVDSPRGRAALKGVTEILRQIIVNSEADALQPDELVRVAAELGYRPPGADVSSEIDVPDMYFGGTLFHRAVERTATERLQANTTESLQDLRSVIQWEDAALERITERWKALAAVGKADTPDPAPLTIDQGRLERYLRARFPGSPNLRIADFRQLVGGRSKQTALFKLTGCAELPAALVVRRNHPQGVTGTTVVNEYPLLQFLHKAGIKVPEPHLVEPSSDPIGGAFILVSEVPGTSAGTLFDPPQSRPLALALATEVGRLHSQPAEVYIPVIPTTDKAPTRQDFIDQLQGFEDMWNRANAPAFATMRYAFTWLRANATLADGPRTFVHRDLGFHNVLRDQDTFIALLDWEFSGIGHPAEDLGYVRPSIEAILPWAEFIAQYERCGGPRIDRRQVDFYAIWGHVRLASLVSYVRSLIDSRVTTDIELATSSVVDLYRILRRLSVDLLRAE